MKRSLALTTLVQTAVVASTFVQYGFISRWRGTQALGDFSLLIRVRGMLEFAILLILPMAIARELAMHAGDGEARNRRVVVQAGMALGLLCLALSVGLMLVFRDATAVVLFGRESFAPWVVPFCILLAGFASCLLVAAVARGSLNFEAVNVLQFLYVAAVPIGLILLGRALSLAQIVSGMGIGAAVLACAFYLRVRPRIHPREPGIATLSRWQAGVGLLKYGTPRLTVIACMSVQSLALPWLVNRHGDAGSLAGLNALLGVVSASTLLVAPLGLVMLPHLSRLIALGQHAEASLQTSRLLVFTLLAGGLGSLAVIAFIRPIVTIWLGPEIAAHTVLLVAAAFVVPAFLVLEVMRAPLDSISTVPWNALTYLGGAAAIVAVFSIGRQGFGWSIDLAAAASLCIGTFAAAAISMRIGIHLYQLSLRERSLRFSVGIWISGFVLLAAGCFWMTVLQQIVVGVAFISLYVTAVLRFAPQWLVDVMPAALRSRISRRAA